LLLNGFAAWEGVQQHQDEAYQAVAHACNLTSTDHTTPVHTANTNKLSAAAVDINKEEVEARGTLLISHSTFSTLCHHISYRR
jgi:hypothetical protein